jgi:hypothetical protein
VAEDLFVDSGGVRIPVRDYGGDGVPLVLVHGHYVNLERDLGFAGAVMVSQRRQVLFACTRSSRARSFDDDHFR